MSYCIVLYAKILKYYKSKIVRGFVSEHDQAYCTNNRPLSLIVAQHCSAYKFSSEKISIIYHWKYSMNEYMIEKWQLGGMTIQKCCVSISKTLKRCMTTLTKLTKHHHQYTDNYIPEAWYYWLPTHCMHHCFFQFKCAIMALCDIK